MRLREIGRPVSEGKEGSRQRLAVFRFLKSGISLGLCFVYVFYQIGAWTILKYPLFGITLLLFFMSLPGAKPAPRYFSLLMFAAGTGWYVQKGESFETVVNGLLANVPLLSLIILVPLLSIPLKTDGYFLSVHFYMKKWLHDAKKLFTFITLFIFLLGPILNLGTLRVLHDMLKDLKIHPVILVKGYMTGFSAVIVWSPYFASVAMVLYLLRVPVLDYLPYGLGMALTFYVLGNLLFRFWHRSGDFFQPFSVRERDSRTEQGMAEEEGVYHRNKVRNLLLLVAGLMISVFFVEAFTGWPMIFLVSLLALTFPFLWLTLRRSWKKAVPYFHEYAEKSLPTFNNETVLFLSAGWFSSALMNTSAAVGIQHVVHGIASASFLLFVVTVVCAMLFLTFLGVHPIVIVTLLLTQIHPAQIGVRPEVLALIVMISWAASAVASPVNPLNLLVSSATKVTSLNAGLRWNGPYLLLILLTGIMTVCALYLLEAH